MAPQNSLNTSPANLFEICKQRLDAIVTQEQLHQFGITAPQLAKQVAKIVQRNLASGRANKIISHQRHGSLVTPALVERYIDAVIPIYLAEHQRVERLADGDEDEWTRFQIWLTKHAYRILQRWPVAGRQAKEDAADFAQQACKSIFNVSFPYDVPFHAWTLVILTNLIRQRYMRSRDLMDRNPTIESLDGSDNEDPNRMTFLQEILVDPVANDHFERVDLQQQLLDAIARLPSRAQQDVILYSYLYGWSDEQIAEHMHKTNQAIYNLRHRALKRLREILLEEIQPKDDQAN